MMEPSRPSDEILSAFVDGEFCPEDRLSTLKLIAADEHLSRKVCDLYQLKELVTAAYRADVLPTPQLTLNRTRHPLDRTRHRNRYWPALAAGLAILALAGGSLLELTRGSFGGVHPLQQAQIAGDASASVPLPAVSTESSRVLFHVTEILAGDAAVLLDDIEYLFETALLQGQPLNVQMVVHGTALDLVRADLSPFPHRMAYLVRTYPGLRITACSQSLTRSQEQEGVAIRLLPLVEPVESGVREAAQRQAEGWTYIRV